DDEPPRGIRRNDWLILLFHDVGIDSEPPTQRHTVAVVMACIHIMLRATLIRFPRNDEAAIGCHRDRRLVLIVGGRGVNEEFTALRDPRRIKTLTVNTVLIAILAIARPYDNKIPIRGHRHR